MRADCSDTVSTMRPFGLPLRRLAAVLLLPGLIAACATKPPASDKEAVAEYQQANDPLEPTNRVMYQVNDAIDAVVLKPVALAYHYVVPSPVRTGFRNAITNIQTPVILANDILQWNGKRAGDTLSRFAINSTLGIGGLFDVAGNMGIKRHDTDFGVTMALWGVPEGPFLFLPILGPSNPRDASGYGVDVAMSPTTWFGQGATVNKLLWAQYSVSAADMRDQANDVLNSIQETSLDPYATFRSLFRQHRASVIEDARNKGTVKDEDLFPASGPGQP
ncbi:MlaA family lipoprotein [Granulibacter bethesdensis]|uniref:MlaA family lipoprotein n=1 Tax=Granulibacter bethesdensis TaxID=364410 RepID=UPI0003F1CCA7|nr:VacJ family lipoprotein [Granulibacter bethesdensis]AHJ64577.1 Lipoprotein [Granulibacter bethesdensis CGDNIH4]